MQVRWKSTQVLLRMGRWPGRSLVWRPCPWRGTLQVRGEALLSTWGWLGYWWSLVGADLWSSIFWECGSLLSQLVFYNLSQFYSSRMVGWETENVFPQRVSGWKVGYFFH